MKPNVFVLGTCRTVGPVKNLLNKKKVNFDYSSSWNVYCTKEIIQKINLLKKEIKMPKEISKFIVCSGEVVIDYNYILRDNKNYLKDIDIFIVELCTTKTFLYKNYSLNQTCVNDELKKENACEIAKNAIVEKQTEQEIIEDLNKICELINKKIIFVNHFYFEGLKIPLYKERFFIKTILEKFCDNKQSFHFDPSIFVTKEKLQDDYHYSKELREYLSERIYDKINYALAYN